jgi:Sulfotransferase domain
VACPAGSAVSTDVVTGRCYGGAVRRTTTLPTFLVIGAMKSGSTTLYNHLRAHPRVFMPSFKEPEFFVAEKTWSRGLSWYQSLFADAGNALAVGEASTSYTKFTEFPGVPERISRVIPEVRLIYLLRDPLVRIRSMYGHMVLTGRERRPIDEAVLTDDTYVGPSLYAENIRLYLEHFPREQLLVMVTEDLRDDPVGAVGKVTRFLQLPPEPGYVPSGRVDLKTDDRRMDTRLKSRLRDVPGAHLAIERMPRPVRAAARRAMTRPTSSGVPALGPAAERELLDRIRPDLVELRDHLGPGFDAWGLLHERDLPTGLR